MGLGSPTASFSPALSTVGYYHTKGERDAADITFQWPAVHIPHLHATEMSLSLTKIKRRYPSRMAFKSSHYLFFKKAIYGLAPVYT